MTQTTEEVLEAAGLAAGEVVNKIVGTPEGDGPPVSIALAVPWCPWIPERVASMDRLCTSLGIVRSDAGWGAPASSGVEQYREFTDKASNDVWSEKVFDFLAEAGTDWCMQIQEDALVPANFWAVVQAILKAVPADIEIVGLSRSST